jgi:hypothetical protein
MPLTPLVVHGDAVASGPGVQQPAGQRLEIHARGAARSRSRWWPEPHATLISVSDNGSGITAEALPRIFDLFVQDPRALVLHSGGLGIGLAVARDLVEAHGGHISASSAGSDLGSEFVVTLPTSDGRLPTRPLTACRLLNASGYLKSPRKKLTLSGRARAASPARRSGGKTPPHRLLDVVQIGRERLHRIFVTRLRGGSDSAAFLGGSMPPTQASSTCTQKRTVPDSSWKKGAWDIGLRIRLGVRAEGLLVSAGYAHRHAPSVRCRTQRDSDAS